MNPVTALLVAALGLYGLAAGALLGSRGGGRPRASRAGWALFGAGFVAAASAVVLRGVTVGHIPLQGMFEVFVFLGACAFPLAVLTSRLLHAGPAALDALLGAVLLVPAIFVFPAEPKPLPPALQSILFGPHVVSYMLAYVVLFKAGLVAGGLLLGRPGRDAMHRLVSLALPMMTAGLVLGAVWGQRAWGDWWNWDPKEMWSLAGWLLFVLYLHVRAMSSKPRPKLEASLVLLGVAVVIITLLWVNLSSSFSGLHSYAG
jgi:ABC-type transport system involved in cytochrome c biogenesis permease subunit